MNLARSVEAIATTRTDRPIDWPAVADAAKALTTPGNLDLSQTDRSTYAADIRTAREAIRDTSGLSFDIPDTIEVQHRHHWIDANIDTFERVLAPLETQPLVIPGVTARMNTVTMAPVLAFLGNHVLGQYDPLLLADEPDHSLYFVHPNIQRVATELDVSPARFPRWIAFHEVTHAAEFGAAPWLAEYLETRMEHLVAALGDGRLERTTFSELDEAMTVVEGYAEYIMDRAFDDTSGELRAKVDARRRGGGPLSSFFRRLLGLRLKRRQYERGKAFFEAITDQHDPTVAAAVWAGPDSLPTSKELDDPDRWLARVGPA